VKLRTTSIADVDVAEAGLWMDQQQTGLGATFLEAVERTFAQIVGRPLAFPTFVSSKFVFKSPLRSATVDSSAYRVIFSVQADEVVVVAVLHAHRDLDTILSTRVGTV
jgi:hypothetical protein